MNLVSIRTHRALVVWTAVFFVMVATPAFKPVTLAGREDSPQSDAIVSWPRPSARARRALRLWHRARIWLVRTRRAVRFEAC